MNLVKFPHLLVVIVCILCGVARGGAVSRQDSLLAELDKVIADKSRYEAERRGRIDVARARLAALDNDEERYDAYRGLFSAYRSFRNDSAIIVARERLMTARRLASPEKTVSALLNLAEGLSSSGNYGETLRILDSIPRDGLREYHTDYLYRLYGQTYMRMAEEESIGYLRERFLHRVGEYRDSTLSRMNPSDENYQYLKAWRLMGERHWGDALGLINRTEAKFGSIDANPGILSQKAVVCHELGMTDVEQECLTRAAIIDIREGRKDYSALIDLAVLLNSRGDSKRAYRYIRVALEDASFCGASARTTQSLRMIPIIDAARREAEMRGVRSLRVAMGIIILLAVALAVALRFSRRRLREVRRMSRLLDSRNKSLEQDNIGLAEENHRREEIINSLFDAHSNYVRRINDFRKNVARLMVTGNSARALDALKSDSIVTDEIRELYASFDMIFLKLYPDFIARFNALVGEEDRLPADTVSLPSAVRVLALMKAGVTSTSRIAALLHYTPQTVYNYKNRLKALFGAETFNSDSFLSRL